MDDSDEFLNAVLPRLKEADNALHNGDAGPRKRLWSHNDPATLFGAALSGNGWTEISAVFDKLATRFSNLRSAEMEVVASGVSGDLAYIAAIERTSVSILGAPPSPYSLRVTTVLRREGGEWKVVHRHADEVAEASSKSDLPRLS